MLPLERQEKILEILSKRKAITVDELCSELYSSGATIRRDLAALESNRLIHRTHGGAVFIDGTANDFPLTLRESKNMLLKERIAAKALPLIHDGMTLFMDSSSTVNAVAERLNGFRNLRVVTNGIKTCNILSEKEGVEVYCTGGKLRENAKSLTGAAALRSIGGFYADLTLFSCRGVMPNGGFSDTNEDEAELKRAYMRNSDKVILLCDSTKLGKKYFCKIGELQELWQLLTDIDLPAEYGTFPNEG